MKYLSIFSLMVLSMLHAFSAVAGAEDSHINDAQLAVENKNFTQAEIILSDHLKNARQ